MSAEDTGRSLSVVVSDDHEVIAHGVEHMLSTEIDAVDVFYCRSVIELCRHADVALLDLRLCDGSTVAGNLRQLDEWGVPAVAYTSADDPVLIREAIAHGALAILRKTASAAELASALKAAANGDPIAGLDWAAALDADEDFVVERLTEVEAQVLTLYAGGALPDMIARHIGIAPSSVTTYIGRIRKKYRERGLNVDSRVDLFLRAAEDGLVSYYGPSA